MPRLNPGHALRSLVPQSREQRMYLLAALINVYGTGLIFTAMTLYALRVVHLSAVRSGLALTIAGLVGLLSAMPIGRLADRRGPRDVSRLALLLLGTAAASYVFFAHSFVSYLIVAIVDGSALSASSTASVALLRRVGANDATTFRSQASAVLNLGMSLGIATCGVAIELNTVTAYRALFLGNAASCLIGAAVLSRLPKYEPLPGAHEESPFAALKDRAFVAYTALSGAMYMQYMVLALLLPVWVVFHTNAPRWTVSAFVIVNTLIVVLFQVRVGKTVKTIRQGGAAFRRAGVIFLVSCSAMGLAAGLPAWGALLLLAGAVIVHTYGELWHASGMYALDFGLAPPHAQGQYQGLVGMGNFAGQALSPFVLIGLVLSGGRLGFVLLGAWLALLGLAGPAVARWGERTRPPAPAVDPAFEAVAVAEQATVTD
ncbi:MAG: MFS transporter [Streptosporangiaceae bacterium]|jgi:MFS family permease